MHSPEQFAVNLGFFSGPMDLLLHLVQKQEVPISEVNLSEICEQYLALISNAKDVDLDKASEYLVVAATLTALKSQSLLPIESTLSLDELSQMEGDQDFYAELRKRLLAYEKTKLQAEALREIPQLGISTFRRRDSSVQEFSEDIDTTGETGYGLGVMFVNLLKRIGESVHSMRIRLESASVVNFMMRILDSFGADASTSEKKSFKSLLFSFGKESKTHSERIAVVVASFIATLELVKRGLVEVAQASGSEDIVIQSRIGAEDRALVESSLDSEFDTPPAQIANESDEAEDPRKVLHMSEFRKDKPEDLGAEAFEEALSDRKEVHNG